LIFLDQNCVSNSHFHHACYMSGCYRHPSYNHPKVDRQGELIQNVLVM
jgi:hypothetical protein